MLNPLRTALTVLFLLVPQHVASLPPAPGCDASQCRSVKNMSPGMMQHLANRAVDNFQASTEPDRKAMFKFFRQFDRNQDGKLNKDEMAYLMRTHHHSVERNERERAARALKKGRKAVSLKNDDFTVPDYLRAMGMGEVDADWVLENEGNGEEMDYNKWIEHKLSHEHKSQNEETFGATIRLIQAKHQKLGPSPCEVEIRAALKVARHDAAQLPTLSCLTLKPAHALCECFGYVYEGPVDSDEAEQTSSDESDASGHHLQRRAPWTLPGSWGTRGQGYELIELNTRFRSGMREFTALNRRVPSGTRINIPLGNLGRILPSVLRLTMSFASIATVVIAVVELIFFIISQLHFFNCKVNQYRTPVQGRLEPKNEGDAVQAEITTVEDCARVCYQSGFCGGFSVTQQDDVNKVMCRIAINEEVDVVEDDQSTTWYSDKRAPNPFSNGVGFADLVQNFKTLWKSGTPGTTDKWKIAMRGILISLTVMGNCLDQVAHVFPDVVEHMNTKYRDVKDFDSGINQMTKFMSAGFAGNREAIKNCAYMDNPDGLEALAAANLYFQSRSINLFHQAGELVQEAYKNKLYPGDGYVGGVPTPGLDPQFRIILRKWPNFYSENGSSEAETDTDYEMEDSVDSEPAEPGSDSEYGSIPDVFSEVLEKLAIDVATKLKFKEESQYEEYQWLRYVAINVGQGDCGYQEFNKWSCKVVSVGGKKLKMDPIMIMRFSGICKPIERRRVWVDCGTGRTGRPASTAAIMATLGTAGFTYAGGSPQPYVFDEAVITHLDTDHYEAIMLAVTDYAAFGMFQWILKAGAQIRWNNYFDQDWRDRVATGALLTGTNPYFEALNHVVNTVGVNQALNCFKKTTFAQSNTDTSPTWRKKFNDNNVPIPNPAPYWIDLIAKIQPEYVAGQAVGTNAAWTWTRPRDAKGVVDKHLKLWYAVRRNFFEVDPVYQGASAPGQFPTVHATSILWPRKRTLELMAQRHSFGGRESDTTSWQLAKREEANSTFVHNSTAAFVDLQKRADTGFAPWKNHLSITHKVTINRARVVMTGDAISQSFGFMSADGQNALGADLFKVPHHGSSKTGERQDLRGIQADKIVVSGRYSFGGKKPPTLNTDGGEPYSTKYLLWIIGEHWASRSDKRLDLYITDFPVNKYTTVPLRYLKDRIGSRPQDCNYRIYTVSTKFFSFNTRTDQDGDDVPPIYDYVYGAREVPLGTPGKGPCDADTWAL
ncbi:hypothetical protein HK097_006994 [Rhizophlyctis rosea]|uniref:EF-hand domain-containing protein n=1 Tax=Rhizophlyctis rosea TaxID=64517 RepID=A0AAD5SF89_9FUNG|nr:hypothetical protein HK097_006994 [Rhizophlyctis rosea]